MPKDAKKNVDRYKLRGGDLNEFEFRQNQAQVKEPVSGGKQSARPGKGATADKSAAKKSAAKKSTATKSAAKKRRRSK